MTKALLSALLLAAAANLPAADAQPNSKPGNVDAAQEFAELDANGDGRLSRREFIASRPDLKRWWRHDERGAGGATERDFARPEVFQSVDVDHDGFISPQEFSRAQITQDTRGRFNRDGRDGDRSLEHEREFKQTPGSPRPYPGREDDAPREDKAR